MQNLSSNDISDLSSKIRFVSHEIRNHLSVCDMYSQIIKKYLEKGGYQNPSVDEALECIQKSLQIIAMNVTDLKSLNVNSQRIVDFKTCVLKSVELSKAYVEDKNIEFEVFVKNSANIKIDDNRLMSCIVNIIKNGIESIEIKGKISVLGEVKDDSAIIKISNDGKMIPPDKQEKIFNCGYTSKPNGSGFGLNICRQYLNSQNANLELVRSNKSETVFKITIPA